MLRLGARLVIIILFILLSNCNFVQIYNNYLYIRIIRIVQARCMVVQPIMLCAELLCNQSILWVVILSKQLFYVLHDCPCSVMSNYQLCYMLYNFPTKTLYMLYDFPTNPCYALYVVMSNQLWYVLNEKSLELNISLRAEMIN